MSRVFHLIPHTHWDREWYLTAPAFRARLVSMLDDLLARLETDARLTFVLDGQTVLVEDYLRVRPDREPAVRSLVERGRLQVGPWYVLADEQIPSGEALVRNLLLGRADAERLGGRLGVLYSPDAFGHPAALPTLAAEFGIPFGVIWRGYGGEAGQERDLLRWRGRDGGTLLVHHLPPDGYEVGSALPAERGPLRERWPALRDALVARAAGPHVAVFVGADHHAVHPGLPRLRDLLAELEPDADIRISRLDDYLTAADEAAAEIPEVDGELRWSYGYTWTLQGTHGTRLPLKWLNDECQLALERAAEPLAALATRHGGTDRRPLLAHAWRTLVRSQFHDSICGCTTDPVARAVEVRLDAARATAREIARASLQELVGHDPDAVREAGDTADPRLLLWNPAARARGGVVVVETTWFIRDLLVGPPGGRIARGGQPPDCVGLRLGDRPLVVQELGRGRGQERVDAARHYPDQDEVERVRLAVMVPPLDGFGCAEVMATSLSPAGAAKGDGVTVRGGRLVNHRIEVGIGGDGAFELRDRQTGRRYAGLLQFECEADVGDTYSFCPVADAPVERSGAPSRVHVIAHGPLVAALEARWSLGPAAVRVVVSLRAGDSAARCTVDIDSYGRDYRLRARIPTGVAAGSALAGAAFGAVVRDAVAADAARYSRETPVATAPAHRFVAVAGERRGIAVLGAGFMEYELDPAGAVLVTLLRAVGELSRGELRTRPGHAGWPEPTPLAQCIGRHRLQLGLLPLAGADEAREERLIECWEDLFVPVRGVWLRRSLPLTLPPTGVTLDGDGLVFTAMKPAESGEGTVLRCVNARDAPVAGRWYLATPARSASRIRADEQVPRPLQLQEGGRVIPFAAGPRELVTVLID